MTSRWRTAGAMPVVALVVLFAVYSVLKPDVFLSKGNLLSVFNQQAVLVLVAIGLTQVLIVGQFDLSFGSVMSLSAAISAGTVSRGTVDLPLALILGLLVGLGVGLVNGVIVEYFRVNALVATLAVGSMLDGATLWYTNGETIFDGIPNSFLVLARWNLVGVQGSVFYMLVVAALLWVAAKRFPVGRYMYATGSNRTASEMIGIPVRRMTILGFCLSGVIAAFAGVLQASRDGSVQPLFGASYLLPAFAAAFLGAATLSRGRFHVWGTLFGAYLIAIGTNGFVILGAPFYTQQLFAGGMLLLATATPGVLSQMRSFARPAPTAASGGGVAAPVGGASDGNGGDDRQATA